MAVSAAASAPPPTGIRASGYLPELEALRGIAVLLVYAFHADRYLAVPLELRGVNTRTAVMSPLLAFVRAGHTGVSLFFVLSGFLLSLPFLAEAAGGARVDRRRYIERRALRILPLYWLAVFVAVVATGNAWWQGALYLVFANGVTVTSQMPPYTNVMWSLATEAQYYVLLPLLPFVMRNRVGGALLVLYTVTYAAWMAGWLLPQSGAGAFRLAASVYGRGWSFLAGITVAWLYRTHGQTVRAWAAGIPWVRRGGADVLLVLVTFMQGMLLLWSLHQSKQNLWFPPGLLWQLPEVIGWALVVAIVLLAPLRLKGALCNPVLVRIGILSYSIYLWHVPLLHYGLPRASAWWGVRSYGWNAAGFVAFGLVTLAVLTGSALTYALVERPFLRRKARLAV